MKFNKKSFLIWLAIFVSLFVLFQFVPGSNKVEKTPVLIYSDFINKVKESKVNTVTIKGRNVVGVTKAGEVFKTYSPSDSKMVDILLENNVKLSVLPPDPDMPSLFQIVLSWLPILLLIGLAYLSVRSLQSNGNRAFGLGRSRVKATGEKDIKVTFADVAGIDEAKSELEEIVEFLKNPQKFQKLGGRIPRGVLLSGPPGNGKTLLARAIAGEAGVMFFNISGSEFVEVFVGVGASRVRDMFEQAKRNAPCIIFIDEIDAVGRKRSSGFSGGHEEREQTLNQLLVEMDGFEQNQGIIIVAATNRPDVLDSALLRPGRFDRRISVSFPDVDGREKILGVHARNVPLFPDVDLRKIARGTPGFSGADLANIINEAALLAARLNQLAVSQKNLESAKDKIIMGTERRSWLMNPKERDMVAHHEAGHAILALYTPGAKPMHKITIIPRGSALGMVVQLPERDQLLFSREEMLADIIVSMGGRVAEHMFFGEDMTTAGASNDIEQATARCRRMVMEYALTIDSKKTAVFQNYLVMDDAGYRRDYAFSEKTLERLDSEVERILGYCYEKAKALMEAKKEEVHLLAKTLLDRETLDVDEVKTLLKNGKLPRITKAKSAPSRRLPKSV